MSLRGKIVLLFLTLAILPLMGVAGFGYVQARKLAQALVSQSVQESVRSLGPSLTNRAAEIEGGLEELALEASAGSEPPDGWDQRVRSVIPEAVYLRELPEDGSARALSGAPPDSTYRCIRGRGMGLATFRSGRLELGVWMDDLMSTFQPASSGSVRVVERADGRVVASSHCSDMESGQVMLGASALTPSASDSGNRDPLRRVDLAGDGRWAVVSEATADAFLSPLNRLQATYWLFVLMVAIATVLAFSVLLENYVVPLEEITRAADRIGDGQLDPWLPPPGDDEVGRLSLAFSGMLERVRQTLRRVDHSGRLAVIGRLSAYLAHEIRNPLSSIRMNLQSLQRDVRSGRIPADCGDAVEISLKEVDRLAGSVTSVLQLGRPSSGEREVVSIHHVIGEATDLVAAELRRAQIALTVQLDADADRAVAVAGQIKGVFLNLIMNALDAQPDGGRVDIHSYLVSGGRAGPRVAVALRDWGPGIAPELRHKIFEPFFSTKPQGSGIGLALAHRTIREHGGELYLADLPESAKGTEFVVELPLAAMSPESSPELTVGLPPWMTSSPTKSEGDLSAKAPLRATSSGSGVPVPITGTDGGDPS